MTILERLQTKLADRYSVERELGKGGMATVYLARDIRHDREVAIKVLHPELSASIGAERFEREIKLSAKLQHPHILGLIDSGEADGLLYYVMPFVKGESLRDRLDREGQLPIEDAIQVVLEVADALGYAHAQGIIHRDIKPENILISGGHSLVADFGIARAATEAGGQKLTQTGMAVGTPVYMAPEQSVGDAIGPTADLYSLGCVLYEMLAGEPPFTAKNPQALMARHAMEAVPSIRIVRNTVPEEVEDTIFASMAKVPADRPQNAAQFAELLGMPLGSTASRRTAIRHTASRRVPTGAVRAYEPEFPPWWRKPWVIGAAVLVLAGVSALVVPLLRGRARPSAEAGPGVNSIAVLYFEGRGGGGGRGGDSLTYLADGLTETLIKELSAVKGLKVISSNGVRPYRGKVVPPVTLGEALGVRTLLAGHVVQAGDKFRLEVSLINAKDGQQIGEQTITGARGDVFAMQDSLAYRIAVFLRRQLGQVVKLSEARRGTRNTQAWELLQRASVIQKDAESLAVASDAEGAKRNWTTADSLLELASKADGKWQDPVTQRAMLAYWAGRRLRTDKLFNDSVTARALPFAEQAVAMDTLDADAREARGSLKYWRYLLGLELDGARAAKLFAEAEVDLRASVAANPSQATAWSLLSHLLFNKAQAGEAKLAALKAYEHDPYLTIDNVIFSRLFAAALDAGDPFEAKKWCEEGVRRSPNDPRFIDCRLKLNVMPNAKPDIDQAWKLRARYRELSPANTRDFSERQAGMLVAMALVRAGLPDSARRVAQRSRADITMDPTLQLVYWESLMLAMIPDKDAAFERLSTYLATNPQQAKNLEKDDTWWTRSLRDDPRWRNLSRTGR